jgi:hypothetical protein
MRTTMRLFALLLAVLAFDAHAQGLTKYAPGQKKKTATSAPLLTPDAGTVAHVWFPTTAGTVDTKGNSWSVNGTVTFTSSTVFTTARADASGFSVANYLKLGTGSDVMDFTGDFTCYAVVDNGANVMVSDGAVDAAGSGWRMAYYIGYSTFDTLAAASALTRTQWATVAVAVNVYAFGRSGTAQYAKWNLTATQTTAAAKTTAGTGWQARIGSGSDVSIAPFTGKIYEVMCTSTAFTEATVAANITAVLAKVR